jgi:hypothetical protein
MALNNKKGAAMQLNFENQPKRILDPKNEQPVDVPTIKIWYLPGGNTPQAFVQWYGECDLGLLMDEQFFFPVPADVEHPLLFGDPEAFEVVMFAKANEWPFLRTKSQIIELAKGSEAYVLWILLGGESFQHTAERYGFHRSVCGKLECMIVMNIKVASSRYGIIRPQKYLDIGVLLDGVTRTGFCSNEPLFSERITRNGTDT